MSTRSHADLGGASGHGAVVPEDHYQPFHAPWEARVLALTVAMGATGQWTIDQSRAERETLPDYLGLSYFQIWLAALEHLCVARGLVTPAEIRSGRIDGTASPPLTPLAAADVTRVLARGASSERPSGEPPRFSPGQSVRTRREPARHHTRLPGYARGKRGTIERILGHHVFADASAQQPGAPAQWLYTVAFDGSELWDDVHGTAAGLIVSIDAWQDYLEPA